MSSQYSSEVWQRFRTPHYAGVLQGQGVTTGEAQTPASRAILRLYVTIRKGRIEKARFQALGCPSTIATADWLCQWLEGRTKTQAVSDLSVVKLVQALDLVPVRRHCAVLAEDALLAVLDEKRPENSSAGKVSIQTEAYD